MIWRWRQNSQKIIWFEFVFSKVYNRGVSISSFQRRAISSNLRHVLHFVSYVVDLVFFWDIVSGSGLYGVREYFLFFGFHIYCNHSDYVVFHPALCFGKYLLTWKVSKSIIVNTKSRFTFGQSNLYWNSKLPKYYGHGCRLNCIAKSDVLWTLCKDCISNSKKNIP